MSKLHFSYSTLNMLRTHSHCWVLKISGVKPDENIYMKEGKDGHRIIQEHIGGIKEDPRLTFLTDRFATVEKHDFDPACKFSLEVNGYEIIGFYDALDTDRFGEIKLSSSPWTPRKFKDSFQRKIYALSNEKFKTSVLITGSRQPQDWQQGALKIYDVPCTDQDRKEALEWIKEGLQVFEDGDFSRGLDENGRCVDRWCPWGKNCSFKNI